MSRFVMNEGITEWTNPSGEDTVPTGQIVDVGFSAAVCAASLKPGETGTVATRGIFRIPTTTEFEQGDKVFFNTSTNVAVAVGAGVLFIGFCIEDTGNSPASVLVELAPYSAEGAREITLAATGNQTLSPNNFTNGTGLNVKVPNTAALTVTFPSMDDVPHGMPVAIHKNSADAEIVTIAADGDDTLVGTTGQVDAANDRVLFLTADGGPVVYVSIIA